MLTTLPGLDSRGASNPFLKHFRSQRRRRQMLTKNIVEIATNAFLLALAYRQNLAFQFFTGGDLRGEFTCAFTNLSL